MHASTRRYTGLYSLLFNYVYDDIREVTGHKSVEYMKKAVTKKTFYWKYERKVKLILNKFAKIVESYIFF